MAEAKAVKVGEAVIPFEMITHYVVTEKTVTVHVVDAKQAYPTRGEEDRDRVLATLNAHFEPAD